MSSSEKLCLVKLITLGLKDLLLYLSPNTVATLDSASNEGWLGVPSKLNLTEFADIIKIFFGSSNEFSNVTKLAILVISG